MSNLSKQEVAYLPYCITLMQKEHDRLQKRIKPIVWTKADQKRNDELSIKTSALTHGITILERIYREA